VVIDVGGFFSGSGSMYHPLTPARIIDTRPGTQVGPFGTPLGSGGIDVVTVAGHGGVPATAGAATAVVANIAVTNTTASSYLTAYPSDAPKPLASDLNWTPGATVPNLVVTKLSVANGQMGVFNFSGSVDFVVDVAGYYGP
jgi:hypothetical protein